MLGISLDFERRRVTGIARLQQSLVQHVRVSCTVRLVYICVCTRVCMYVLVYVCACHGRAADITITRRHRRVAKNRKRSFAPPPLQGR